MTLACGNSRVIGHFDGYWQQEYEMDSKMEINYYVKPDSTCVVRVFTMNNFIFYDEDDVILRRPLLNQNGVKKMGQEYEVQNNHMNGQIVCVV